MDDYQLCSLKFQLKTFYYLNPILDMERGYTYVN